mgnify:CR=1 FL=1
MDEFPFDGEGILRVAVAKKIGIDPHRIYRAAREHKIEPLVPGVYVLPTARRPVHRHRLEALSASVGPGTVISHSSAAVVHQLAMLRPDLSRLHITAVEGSAGYRRSHRFLHPGRLAEADIVEVDGVRLTSPARTAFDVARTSPAGFPGSLAVFDSALRAHVDVDLLCVTDAGMPTYSVTRAFAFGGACIGSPYVASVFSLSGPSPDAGFVALDAFTGAALQVRRSADVNVLVNGGGAAETWTLVRPIASPYPYTCGQQAPLRFRVFGR